MAPNMRLFSTTFERAALAQTLPIMEAKAGAAELLLWPDWASSRLPVRRSGAPSMTSARA